MNKNKSTLVSSEEIYTAKITKGSRTYFFDIKKSEQGDLYLKISESKKIDEGYEHHHVMIFDEAIVDFVDTFQKTLTKFKELKAPSSNEKKYSVEQIRKTHQNAYMSWTEDEDNRLELLFCEGKKSKELAQIFGRKEGAISSRIKKLELREKYS